VHDVFGDDLSNYPETNLTGSYQRRNAATATVAARRLRPRFNLPDALIARSLLTVDWPGRWQRIEAAGRVFIFDAAHNPEGALCLDENLQKLAAQTGSKPHLLVGVLGAVRAQSVLPIAARHAQTLSLVSVPDQERSCTPKELRQWVPQEFAGPINLTDIVSLFPGSRTCLLGQPGETIVVTGSIYLIGQVMDRIQNDEPVGQGSLQD
jgi:dihydrofolate synthase/folylpolyglutamate synthase